MNRRKTARRERQIRRKKEKSAWENMKNRPIVTTEKDQPEKTGEGDLKRFWDRELASVALCFAAVRAASVHCSHTSLWERPTNCRPCSTVTSPILRSSKSLETDVTAGMMQQVGDSGRRGFKTAKD